MKKILIAEDDRFLANAYRVKLTHDGFDVRITFDGHETIKATKEFKPDLLILDIIMPMQDGFSVIEELRADSEFAKLPILIASNLGQTEDMKKAKSLGANEYIVKSQIKLEEIVGKIKKILGE